MTLGLSIALFEVAGSMGLFLFTSYIGIFIAASMASLFSHGGLVMTNRHAYVLRHSVFFPTHVLQKKPLSNTSAKITLDDGFSHTNYRFIFFHSKLEGLVPTSRISSTVTIHHKEKFTNFLRVLSSLGFTGTPSNAPFGTACSVPPPSRVIVTIAGYVIIFIIWIIGISQDWGFFF